MTVTTLQLTPRDPIIARDSRPFGADQGNRMRSLSWPLPSVIAGSFRTALGKASPNLQFDENTVRQLLQIEVAGVFPCCDSQLYLPAPNDCLWNGESPLAVKPIDMDGGGCDFPVDGLQPVMLSKEQSADDFKPEPSPAWWPLKKMTDWLLGDTENFQFDNSFLNAPNQDTRDHVSLAPDTGAAAKGKLFTTVGLNVSHLSRFNHGDSNCFEDRYAEITLSLRVADDENAFEHIQHLDFWHPLGGERRLVHWKHSDQMDLWKCPDAILSALNNTAKIRMILASPAIFENGWLPGWLDKNLVGQPFRNAPKLKLVGVCIPRWRAVSGWSYAPYTADDGRSSIIPKSGRGPKAIRRMVPAGGVYFFLKVDGDASILATEGWLKAVSDALYDRRDGFGLAVWGIWDQK